MSIRLGASGEGAIWEQVKAPILVEAQTARTASYTTASVDRNDYNGIIFLVDVGAVTGTSPTESLAIQDSADNSTFALVTSANQGSGALGTAANITSAGQLVQINVDARKMRRYLNFSSTIGGTTPSFTQAIIAILAGTDFYPAV